MNHSELEELVPIGTAVHRQVNLATARCRIRFFDGCQWCDPIVREALLEQGIYAERYQKTNPPFRDPRVNDLQACVIANTVTKDVSAVHLEIWNGSEWRCIKVGKIVGKPMCFGYLTSLTEFMMDPAFKVREVIEKNWVWPAEEAGLLTSASSASVVPTVVAEKE